MSKLELFALLFTSWTSAHLKELLDSMFLSLWCSNECLFIEIDVVPHIVSVCKFTKKFNWSYDNSALCYRRNTVFTKHISKTGLT